MREREGERYWAAYEHRLTRFESNHHFCICLYVDSTIERESGGASFAPPPPPTSPPTMPITLINGRSCTKLKATNEKSCFPGLFLADVRMVTMHSMFFFLCLFTQQSISFSVYGVCAYAGNIFQFIQVDYMTTTRMIYFFVRKNYEHF